MDKNVLVDMQKAHWFSKTNTLGKNCEDDAGSCSLGSQSCHTTLPIPYIFSSCFEKLHFKIVIKHVCGWYASSKKP